jgi:integrase
MKKRATPQLMIGLRLVDDGKWMHGDDAGREPRGNTVFAVITSVFERCPWLRKNGKPMSAKSRIDYGSHIMRSYRDLKELGFKLQKPWNLEAKHIEALCRKWSEARLSASTVQNRLGVLSWFSAVIGRPGLVLGTHEYNHCFGGVDMQRHQATERDKSPEGRGRDRDEVIAIAMAEDLTFGHMVMLQYALGLRDKEVIRARPLRDMRWMIEGSEVNRKNSDARKAEGDHWVLPPGRGSKGGRARIILLKQGEWQMDAIRKVQAFMAARGKGLGQSLVELRDASMGWSCAGKLDELNVEGDSAKLPIYEPAFGGLSIDMNRYRSLCRKVGFTKQELGFTGHAFRHSFAHRELEANGFIAVIKSRSTEIATRDVVTGLPVTEDQTDALNIAKLNTSRQLGHSRVSVTASYYGSVKVRKLKD